MTFIGRTRELSHLEKMYQSGRFEMAVIYGRRRIGKTTLINQFCQCKKAVMFTAVETTARENLSILSELIYRATNAPAGLPPFPDFRSAFHYLSEAGKNERLILVIDEYPYLASGAPEVSSILQAAIDQEWRKTQLFLILAGSSMSFMEHQVLGYKSPLYGRRTAQFRILPFTYQEAFQALPSFNIYDQALLYGVTGGIPEYLNAIDPSRNADENLVQLFFDPQGRLYEEPTNLLQQEMNTPAMYNALISSIAGGHTRLSEIASDVGRDTSAIVPYLNALIGLDIIAREHPITETESSRKTIYLLKDQMFRFWYRFVFPNISMISAGYGETVYQQEIQHQLPGFMGKIFEIISRQYLLDLQGQNRLPCYFGEIGRWWGGNPVTRRQEEIDLMAVHDHAALFGECKWREEPVDAPVLQKLIERAGMFHYDAKYYYLFSKTGFTGRCRDAAAADPAIHLVAYKDMAATTST